MKNNVIKDYLFGFLCFCCVFSRFLFVCLFNFLKIIIIKTVEIPLAGGPSFLGTGTGFLSSGTCLSGTVGTLKR